MYIQCIFTYLGTMLAYLHFTPCQLLLSDFTLRLGDFHSYKSNVLTYNLIPANNKMY